MNMETPKIKNERYELQFASPEEIQVKDVTIPVYRLTPEKPATDTYTFFAPAFGQKVEDMYKDVAFQGNPGQLFESKGPTLLLNDM